MPNSTRILVIGINYAPETTGIAPYTTGLCEHLASHGHQVEVITAFPYYPEWRVRDGYRGHIYQKQHLDGVTVRRVWHFVPSRASNVLQRLAHDISFSLSAFLAGLFADPFDVIYCACPPPTAAFSAYVLSKIRRRPYLIKLADLASDAALATGILKRGLALRMALAIEGFVYQGAERIICLCQGFVEKLKARGISAEKLHVISDWADTERIRPVSSPRAFRRANGVSLEQFLLLHTGNMGKKQDLMNVVRAAEISQQEPALLWLLVGHGEERAKIQEEIARRKLTNIRLLPLQPVDAMAEMYSSADALILNQQASVRDAVIPSKLLTYMAAGQAVLAAVTETSEAAQQVRSAKCGLLVPPENPEALVEAALSLRRQPSLRQELGANGRAYVILHFTRQYVLREYDSLFSSRGGEQETSTILPEKATPEPHASKSS
jgi:colanic acid biosynthesis glycosyl transferase WcaI